MSTIHCYLLAAGHTHETHSSRRKTNPVKPKQGNNKTKKLIRQKCCTSISFFFFAAYTYKKIKRIHGNSPWTYEEFAGTVV